MTSSAPVGAETPEARNGGRSDPILEVQEVAKQFGGVHAVAGTTFAVRRGTITGLIGPNGAGKSTMVNLISGFIRPDTGRVIYRGTDMTGWAAHRVARTGLIRTYQLSSEFGHLTVMENLLAAVPGAKGTSMASAAILGKRYWRRDEAAAVARARRLLKRFGLERIEDTYAGELSGGQKRLLEIMRALMGEPALLLLDEPLAGVNPTLGMEVEQVLHGLREDGVTMLLVEHEMGAVERLCDSIVVMALGRVLAEGTMGELRSNQDVLEAYLSG